MQTEGQFWLDRPARVVLQFRGGAAPRQIRVASTASPAGRTITLAARKTTPVTFDLPSGAQRYAVALGWPGGLQRSEDPALTSVSITQGGKTEQLLY